MNEKKGGEEQETQRKKLESFFINSQRVLKEIITSIEISDWEKVRELSIEFKTIVIGKLLISGKETDVFNEAFDKLINICDRPFFRIGNNKLKQKAVRKQLEYIIELMSKEGLYIGQERFLFENVSYTIDNLLFDINSILPYASRSIDIRNEIITKLEFIKNSILRKISMPEKLLIRIIQQVNKLQASIPVIYFGVPSTQTQIELQHAFEELRTFLDFAKLLHERPDLYTLIEERLSSEGKITKETIEKIASTVFDKKIKEFEVDISEE